MHVNWSAMAEVFGMALGATVVIVVLFAAGITALARRTPDQGGAASIASTAAAVLCFLACAAVVGYGLYLIVAG